LVDHKDRRVLKIENYHYCATCVHFEVKKEVGFEIQYICKRLGFITKPNYIFNCWDPKENVKRLIEKRNMAK